MSASTLRALSLARRYVFALVLSAMAPFAMVWLIGPRRGMVTTADAVGLALYAVTVLCICLVIRQLQHDAIDERRRRMSGERVLRRITTLEQVSTAVSRAPTSSEVTSACASELMRAAGATACAVVLLVADTLEVDVVQAFGYDESVVGRFPLPVNGAVATSLRHGEVIVASRDGAADAAFGDIPVLGRHSASLIVPLMTSSNALGVVTLAFDRPRDFDDDERASLLAAGQLAAGALARARLYDSAERARLDGDAYRVRADAELQERRRAEQAHQESEARYRTLAARTHRLYSLSAALSKAITLEAVATAVVREGRSVVGAAAGSVVLCADDAFETLYAEGYPPAVVEAWPRFLAEPGLCTTAAVATGDPVLVGSFGEWQSQYPRSASTAADGGFTSTVSLPMLVDNRPMGVLSFHFTVPLNFDQDYEALLTSVAQHAAQAIDRARLYEATQRARVDAEAANRAKDDFLSIVSHELRTPLNAILGWGAMLRDGSLDETRVGRATEAIVNNASRQARLIDDLLEVSRIVAGRVSLDLQELELADSVRGAVEAMLPVAAQRGLELRVDRVPQARVVADPHRLEQMFGNLLANAVKFTPAGGHVIIDGEVDNGSVRVRVIDTGCGIEADVLPHIFERFRQGNNTTTRSVGGLGLGLFIVRRLAEALQGRVVAESAGKGAGATFTVTLPVVARSVVALELPPRTSAAENAGSATWPDLSGVRVMVVDDEADAREMMASLLGLCGAAVTTAASVKDALANLAAAPFDVLLADLAMPDGDGYELIRRIRTNLNAAVTHLPAVAVTACAREDERRRAIAAGFNLHFAKPIVPGALVETVADLARCEAARA